MGFDGDLHDAAWSNPTAEAREDHDDFPDGVFTGGPLYYAAKSGDYTPLEMFGYFPVEMFGYSLEGITGGVTQFGITGALTLLRPRMSSDVHRDGQPSRTALSFLTAPPPASSPRPTSTKGSTDLPSRASQASQTQQPSADHRDRGDALRI